eukprot:5336271-Pyramimonas_sp.AAC.1
MFRSVSEEREKTGPPPLSRPRDCLEVFAERPREDVRRAEAVAKSREKSRRSKSSFQFKKGRMSGDIVTGPCFRCHAFRLFI